MAPKVVVGYSVAGIAGTHPTSVHPECSFDGQMSCITTNSFRAAEISGLSAKVITGQVVANQPGAYSPDFPEAGNVLSTDTVNGTSGSLTLPSTSQVRLSSVYGVGGNGSTGQLSLPLALNVTSGVGFGVASLEFTGTLAVESHTNCTGGAQSGCITTSTYPSMNLTNKDAGGALDLTSTDFITRIKSASTFEYWDATGSRFTGTGDADISASNIKSAVGIFNTNGTVIERPSDCSAGVYQNCVPTGSFYAATTCTNSGDKNCFIDSASSYDAADLSSLSAGNVKSGITISSVTGNITLPVVTDVENGVSFGSPDEPLTGTYVVPPAGNVAAGIQYGPTGSEITGTATIETHGNCTAEGETNCVTTASFPPTEVATLANKTITGQTIASTAGAASLPAVGTVYTGVTYGIPGSTLTGSLTLPSASNVLSGSGSYGRASAPTTPSYSPDYPNVANVLSTDTSNGVSGTLSLPSTNQVQSTVSYGAGGNGSTGNYSLPAVTDVGAGATYGAAGTEFTGTLTVESHSDCTSGGQTGCVTTSTYKSMDLTNKDSGGALNLTSTDFNTRVKSATTFEYWDATGARHTGTGDSDLTNNNVKASSTLFDVTGSLTERPADCSVGVFQGCVATGSYLAATTCSTSGAKNCFVSTGSSFDAADFTGASANDIKSGVTIGGIAGNLVLPAPADVENSVTYGSPDDLQTGNFVIPAITNVASGIQYGVTGSEVTGTAVIESHSDCNTEGQTNCVTTSTYAPTNASTLAAKVISGQSIAGVNGTASLPAVGVVLTGTSYGVPGANVTGTLTLPAASNVLTGSGLYGNPSAQRTPSYSPDFPSASNVLSTDTVDGSPGTLTNRGTWDMTNSFPGNGYYSGITNAPAAADLRRGVEITGNTGNYPSATSPLYRYSNSGASTATTGSDITDLNDFSTNLRTSSTYEYWSSSGQRLTGTGDSDLVASNIRSGVSIHGVTGSLTETPSDCSSNGSQNCVATGSYFSAQACSSNNQNNCFADSATNYDAVSFTNITAGNIKSGVTIAGVTGDYPSSTYPLPSASGTADLTSANFNSQMRSAATFEYWTSNGTYQTGSGDSDIVSSKVRSGVSIFGITGSYTGPPTQPTGLSTSPVSTSQINLSWNNVSVTGYLLIVRENSSVSFTPSDGTSYSTGNQGSDEIIYVGGSTSYSHNSGVSVGNTYYYALYSYDSNNNYSAVTTTSAQSVTECGGAGNSCYDNSAAKSAGLAVTPGGKTLEYVYANGSSGLQVWKEQGGSRILRANGLDEWAMRLNTSGKGLSSTTFTDPNFGTSSTYLAGRVCPPNVYIDDSNKFTTTNCLYYSPTYSGALNINPASWEWFRANTGTCSGKYMRLPTLYETSDTSGLIQYFLDLLGGNPTPAGSNGVPSGGGQAWTSTSYGQNFYQWWYWNGSSNDVDPNHQSKNIICVLP